LWLPLVEVPGLHPLRGFPEGLRYQVPDRPCRALRPPPLRTLFYGVFTYCQFTLMHLRRSPRLVDREVREPPDRQPPTAAVDFLLPNEGAVSGASHKDTESSGLGIPGDHVAGGWRFDLFHELLREFLRSLLREFLSFFCDSHRSGNLTGPYRLMNRPLLPHSIPPHVSQLCHPLASGWVLCYHARYGENRCAVWFCQDGPVLSGKRLVLARQRSPPGAGRTSMCEHPLRRRILGCKSHNFFGVETHFTSADKPNAPRLAPQIASIYAVSPWSAASRPSVSPAVPTLTGVSRSISQSIP